MIELTLPPGWAAYGASEADPVLSADGATYWGMDVGLNKAWYGYTVWRQSTSGMPAEKVAELPGAGQGRLSVQGDGKLYASAYPKLGDSTTTVVVEVPGYIDPLPNLIRTEVIRALQAPSKVLDAVAAVALGAVLGKLTK